MELGIVYLIREKGKPRYVGLVEVGVLKEEDLESISVPTISSLWAKHRKLMKETQ
jgi:hypothetical protein